MGLLSSLLEEMSTGTGASFSTGTGEQIAIPVSSKKKRRVIRKDLSEIDLSQLEEDAMKEVRAALEEILKNK